MSEVPKTEEWEREEIFREELARKLIEAGEEEIVDDPKLFVVAARYASTHTGSGTFKSTGAGLTEGQRSVVAACAERASDATERRLPEPEPSGEERQTTLF